MKNKADPIKQKRQFIYQFYQSLIKEYPHYTKTDILQLLFQKLIAEFEDDYESLQQIFGMFIFDYYVKEKMMDDSNLIYIIENAMSLDFMCDFLLNSKNISYFITLLYHLIDDYETDVSYEDVDFSFSEFPNTMEIVLNTYHPYPNDFINNLHQFQKIDSFSSDYFTNHLVDLFNCHTFLFILGADKKVIYNELYNRVAFPDSLDTALLEELILFYYSLKKDKEYLEKLSEIDYELLSFFENHSKSEIVTFLLSYGHRNYIIYMIVTFLKTYEGLEIVPFSINKTDEYVKTLRKKLQDEV